MIKWFLTGLVVKSARLVKSRETTPRFGDGKNGERGRRGGSQRVGKEELVRGSFFLCIAYGNSRPVPLSTRLIFPRSYANTDNAQILWRWRAVLREQEQNPPMVSQKYDKLPTVATSTVDPSSSCGMMNRTTKPRTMRMLTPSTNDCHVCASFLGPGAYPTACNTFEWHSTSVHYI